MDVGSIANLPGSGGDADDDAAALAAHAEALADGVETALPGWVQRSVARLAEAWAGRVDPDVARAAEMAGEAAAADIGPRVRALLARDVDDQPSNPLAIVRTAVRHPTAVLADAGVPAVERDAMAASAFPDDVYDLTPSRFADLDPALEEPGISWGAAKAHVILTRRRAEGLR